MSQKEGAFTYPNGQKAFSLMPDGSGFVYYPSGRPACCVSTVSDYQSRYYFYEDAPIPRDLKQSEILAGKMKEHLLCALDEMVVGFAVDNSGGKQQGLKLVCTKTGGLVATAGGVVQQQWKWDRSAQNAGTQPSSPVTLKLNPFMTLTYVDKYNIMVHFSCEGASRTFHLGLKFKREAASYVETAAKVPFGGGKLAPVFDHKTLGDRQTDFNKAMKEKRDLMKPRSETVGESVRHIVQGLEASFDDYASTHGSTRYLDPSWRSASLDTTLSELPPIPLAGTETAGGTFTGFGASLYMTPEAYSQAKRAEDASSSSSSPGAMAATAMASTAGSGVSFGGSGLLSGGGQRLVRLDGIPDHLRDSKTGGFLNDFAVTQSVQRANPLLPRSSLLNVSSGRYSTDLVIPGGVATRDNPTGMAVSARVPLSVVKAEALDEFLSRECSLTQLVCCMCLRDDDRLSRRAQATAEVCHGLLAARFSGGSSSQSKGLGSSAEDILAEAPAIAAAHAKQQRQRSSGGGGGGGSDPTSADVRMVKVDMSESRFMTVKYKVRTVPFLLLFYGGRLVYGGTLGGEALRVPRTLGAVGAGGRVAPWRVLLVEPDVLEQRRSEGVLRKFSVQGTVAWDLVMTGSEASARRQHAASDGGGGDYDLVLLSDKLPEADVAIIERAFKSAAVGSSGGGSGGGAAAGALIVGYASVFSHGRSHAPTAQAVPQDAEEEEKGGAFSAATTTGGGGGLRVGGGSDPFNGQDAYARLAKVQWEDKKQLLCRDPDSKRLLLPSDRHCGAVELAFAKPLKSAHLEALDKALGQRRREQAGLGPKADQTLRGMTVKVLLAALVKGFEDGRRGVFAGGDLASLAGGGSKSEAGRNASKNRGGGGLFDSGGGGVAPEELSSGGGALPPFDLGATLPGSESVVLGTRMDSKGGGGQ